MISAPRRVSDFLVDTPSHSLHDWDREICQIRILQIRIIVFGISVIIFGARITVLSLVVNKTRSQWMYPPSFDHLYFFAGIMADDTGFFFFFFFFLIWRCFFFVAGIITDIERDIKTLDYPVRILNYFIECPTNRQIASRIPPDAGCQQSRFF